MLIAVVVYRYRNVKQTARLFHVVFVKRFYWGLDSDEQNEKISSNGGDAFDPG
jgi:hypothetical protein